MTQQIKPCPFCGSAAQLVQVEEQNGVVVECTGCHASGPLRIHAKDDANPHAIYSWNRRAELDETVRYALLMLNNGEPVSAIAKYLRVQQ